jgi:hypothetical protein
MISQADGTVLPAFFESSSEVSSDYISTNEDIRADEV